MRIHRMQEGIAGDAIRSANDAINGWTLESGSVIRSAVATDGIIACVAEIGVVDPKLCVIEKIECFCAEFKVASLSDSKTLQQAHIEVRPVRIVQRVPASISEGQPPRCYEPVGIPEQWSKALGIESVVRHRCSLWIQIWKGTRSDADRVYCGFVWLCTP